MKILITCPPMLKSFDRVRSEFTRRKIDVTTPTVIQTLTEDELIPLVADHDGWIIGDDPATRRVFEAGKAGKLRAAVKWGVGVDNVDFGACRDLDIPIINTPGMFGNEVADLALGYLIAVTRDFVRIDREVRRGAWPKPPGNSFAGKKLALLGFGDIGRNFAKRVLPLGVHVFAVDPGFESTADGPHSKHGIEVDAGLRSVQIAGLDGALDQADFLVVTCALTHSNRHIVNHNTLALLKGGARVINVARGPLVNEGDLMEHLKTGHISSAALDVFETEPLPLKHPLRDFDQVIFGTHNGSNTVEAVDRTNKKAIALLFDFLGIRE